MKNRHWAAISGLVFLAATRVAIAQPPDHTSDKALIEKFKTTWRAQDGETVDQIIAKASKVAHFVPRGWEIDTTDEGQKSITFSWAKRPGDKADDEYTIAWEVAADGTMALATSYARPIELGWQPFALSLIDSEVAEEDKKPNLQFSHNPSNFNFIISGKGKLGDLLHRGRCAITDDHLFYVTKIEDKPDVSDTWHVELEVNCDISGPRYFTRGGLISFQKRGNEDWSPVSFFARRIISNEPGHWFDHADAHEQEIFDAAREMFRQRLPSAGSR